jgi:hypothetical protein
MIEWFFIERISCSILDQRKINVHRYQQQNLIVFYLPTNDMAHQESELYALQVASYNAYVILGKLWVLWAICSTQVFPHEKRVEILQLLQIFCQSQSQGGGVNQNVHIRFL